MEDHRVLIEKELQEVAGKVIGTLISSSNRVFDAADEDEDEKLNKIEWRAHYKQYINKHSFINSVEYEYSELKADRFYDFLSGLSN